MGSMAGRHCLQQIHVVTARRVGAAAIKTPIVPSPTCQHSEPGLRYANFAALNPGYATIRVRPKAPQRGSAGQVGLLQSFATLSRRRPPRSHGSTGYERQRHAAVPEFTQRVWARSIQHGGTDVVQLVEADGRNVSQDSASVEANLMDVAGIKIQRRHLFRLLRTGSLHKRFTSDLPVSNELADHSSAAP